MAKLFSFGEIDIMKYLTGKSQEETPKKEEKPADKKTEDENGKEKEEERPITLRR